MTKEEVIEKCNKLYAKLEELETDCESLLKDVKAALRLAEDLPSEESETDNTTEGDSE